MKSRSKTSLLDLVAPRVACLNIIGLPFIASNIKVLESLLESMGLILGQVSFIDDDNLASGIKVCVSNKCGETIKVSRKIRLDSQVFLVTM